MASQSQTPKSTNMVLTEDDVQSLLGDSTPEARVGITEKLSFSYNNTQMNEKESLVAEQIFRLLMQDMEVRVRESLSQNIKDNDEIPKDIVMALARDVEEVSLPVLEYSDVLDDKDLIELVRNSEQISRQLAISKRKTLSGELTDTLIDKGNDEVAHSLVNNEGAAITEEGLGKIVEEFSEDEQLMNAVSQRPKLPVATVEKLLNVVSSSLSDELKKKYKDLDVIKPPVEQIEQEVTAVKETQTLNMLSRALSQEEVDELVTQLIAFDRLTPSIILRALCLGNFMFFETSLARLANVPISNVHKLISDQGDFGFRGVYNKSGLPDAMFPAVKMLNAIVRDLQDKGEEPGTSTFANRIVENILSHEESENIENLSYIIALVRRVSE